MANLVSAQDDVTVGADKLARRLLATAESSDSAELQLDVLQAVTRYMACRARISLPEEGNQFDGYRATLAGTTSPSSGERAGPARSKPPRRNGNAAPRLTG